MGHKVVVTGMGVITPIGNTVGDAWNNLISVKSGIDTITKFDASSFKTRFAGEVNDFDPKDYVRPKDIKKMDTFIQYSIACTMQALSDSNLEITEDIAEECGVCVGVGIGGLANIEYYRDVCRDKGETRITPFFIPMTIANMTSGHISILLGTKGYNATTVSACSSANHSIGDSARLIERGDAKVMITGGSESALCPLALGGFGSMKALSTRNDNPKIASRPYDQERDGFVLGEGAGILILENEEFARNRGANIYAEVSGYGFSSDAYHITAPSMEGPSLAMKNALKDARLNPENVDYINAHGTSTPLGDINEINAIKHCFGQQAAEQVSISSSKSMTGHLLGAAGGIESVFAIKAIQENVSPPTINIESIDAECDLDVTPNVSKERVIDVAMNNSFGFGGTNATLIFKKYEG